MRTILSLLFLGFSICHAQSIYPETFTNARDLKRQAPDFYQQISMSGRHTKWKHLWADTLNFDEGAKAQIVKPELLNILCDIFKVPHPIHVKGKISHVHAGLEHTYGYLISTLQTPFGLKRDRWVKDDIEFGFGLPRGTLGPIPKNGTLFLNATYFLGHIAFRSEAKMLEILKDPTLDSTLKYDFSRLKISGIQEEFELHGKKMWLQIDLVEFPNHDSAHKNTHLLVYSLHNPSGRGSKLFTGFPVETGFVSKILSEPVGKDQILHTRYNAWISGVTDFKTPYPASRKVF